MFSFNSERKAGPGYIVLNIIRVLNIITLLMVAASSWVMIVMTVKTSSFFFFDGVSHFITFIISTFLIVSELNLFKAYFSRQWPLLSPEYGFVFLASTMFALGCNVLGNLNKAATSEENLGKPLRSLVIAAGILAMIFGVANFVATFFFCDSKLGITGRQVRSDGATTTNGSTKSNLSVSSGSMRRPPSPILPSYNTTTEERRKSRFPFKLPIRMSGISRPIQNDPEQFSKWESRTSPVAPEVQRPPTALHPAYQHGGGADTLAPPAAPYPASSRYSVASNVTRF
jgi:hypothetical protein